MKRRLRKKLRLGEFQDLCFNVEIRFDPNISVAESNSLMDRWVEEAIESNDLMCGGGGRIGEWHFAVSSVDPFANLERFKIQRSQVEKWLKENGGENFFVGPIFADLINARLSSARAADQQKRINRQHGIDSQMHWD